MGLGTNILGGSIFFFLIIICWTIVWKAIALWLAARNNHKFWFGVMLVVNTIGILEIIYVFAVAMKKPGAKKSLMEEMKFGGITIEEKPQGPEIK